MEERTRVIAAFPEAQLYEALMATFPEQVRIIERKDNLLFTLMDDLLTHALSYACPEAASPLACTSKRLNTLVQRRAFWERAVRARIRSMLAKKPAGLTAGDVEFYSTRWTPFDDDLLPTLKDKVRWLFPRHQTCIGWVQYQDDTAGLEIKYNMAFAVEWGQSLNDAAHYFSKWNSLESNRPEERYKYYWTADTRSGKLYFKKNPKEAPVIQFLDAVYQHGSIRYRWQGCALKVYKTTDGIKPHGKGKWTNYDTGELILEGDDVAFAGKIHDGITWFAGKRMPAGRGEGEPESKRNKLE